MAKRKTTKNNNSNSNTNNNNNNNNEQCNIFVFISFYQDAPIGKSKWMPVIFPVIWCVHQLNSFNFFCLCVHIFQIYKILRNLVTLSAILNMRSCSYASFLFFCCSFILIQLHLSTGLVYQFQIFVFFSFQIYFGISSLRFSFLCRDSVWTMEKNHHLPLRSVPI